MKDNELARLRAEVARLTRHDCERWSDEGMGCAQCNPIASKLRACWDDPVRKERDALKAEVARLREALETLLPGLTLDVRYAEPDDDIDAMRCRVETVRAALDEPAAEQPSGGGGELVRCQKWETCRIVHGCPHSKKHGRIAASKDGTGCDKGLLGCPACVPVKEG